MTITSKPSTHRERYNPRAFEDKWREAWAEAELYKFRPDDQRPKWYALTMYPYPSGDLHIGHWYAMVPSDAAARFRRMQGYNVFFPMGFDAFGLPAENAAIKRNIHPFTWTMANIENMRAPDALDGRDDRLGPGNHHLHAGVLQVEPVDLSAHVRGRAGV